MCDFFLITLLPVVVVVCAFSPTHAIARISNSVITFVNTFRERSNETVVVLSVKAEAIELYSRNRANHNNEEFDDNLIFVNGLPNTIRGLQSVDVCHARSICIIGCEYKSKKKDQDTVIAQAKQDTEEMNTDLYIVLAALELDAILSSYVRRLLRENLQAPLPIVIQEISTDATISFLPDYYSLSRKAKRLWEKHDKKVWESRRGMNTEDVDIGFKTTAVDVDEQHATTEGGASEFSSNTPALSQVNTWHLLLTMITGVVKFYFNFIIGSRVNKICGGWSNHQNAI